MLKDPIILIAIILSIIVGLYIIISLSNYIIDWLYECDCNKKEIILHKKVKDLAVKKLVRRGINVDNSKFTSLIKKKATYYVYYRLSEISIIHEKVNETELDAPEAFICDSIW